MAPDTDIAQARPPKAQPKADPFMGGLPRLHLAQLPTPVRPLVQASRLTGGRLWVKDDSQSSPLYGGNKVRKLEWILAQALVTEATNTWTMGPSGSHHVLAVARFSKLLGLHAHAFLFPEYPSRHARLLHQAILESGCRIAEAPSWLQAPTAFLQSLPGPGTYWIPAGASNPLGNLGFYLAGLELAQQVAAGLCPKPDVLVVALGSAGTAAGLWMGLDAAAMTCRLHAVRVTSAMLANRINLSRQAWELTKFLQRLQAPAAHRTRGPAARHASVRVVTDQFGGTYGKPTDQGRRAQAIAAKDGLVLEPVYTAKAFAHALAVAERCPDARVFFWNTAARPPGR